jgi:branched-chain amino acid transport system permease protein
MARWRPYLLGILGLAAITFPFLWLQLRPNFQDDTTTVAWSPAHGVQFFTDLAPVFVVALLIWAFARAERHFGWSDAIAGTSAWRTTSDALGKSWAWIAMALVLSGPFIFSQSTLGLLTYVGIFMILAVGLNITVGMTGLLVLGYAAFYAFGAYLYAIGQRQLGFFPWWLASIVAFPLGGAVGYLLGLPCLRLRGDYLAIVTLGFEEAFRETIRNLDFTGGDQGIIIPDSARFASGLLGGKICYVVVALVLFLAVFLVQRLYHSPIGRAWIAIRENEIAAASVGVPVVRMKLLAFSISAAVAALAGVLSGAKDGFVSPELCQFQNSVMVLAMVILGGLGNTYGVIFGAALLYLVPEYLKLLPTTIRESSVLSAIVPDSLRDALQHLSDYRLLLFGAVMVFMMLYRPQGLLGSRRRKTEMMHE